MKYKVEAKLGTYVFFKSVAEANDIDSVIEKTISNQELETFSCPVKELNVGDVIEVCEENGVITKINRIPTAEKSKEDEVINDLKRKIVIV